MNNILSKETLFMLLTMCELAYTSSVTLIISKLGLSLDKLNELFGYNKPTTTPYKVGKSLNATLTDFLKGITG